MSEKYTLLVEDNPDDVTLTEIAFRKARISTQLVVVNDGREALDFLFQRGKYAAGSFKEKPAVILLDLKLPFVSGLEVLREIRIHETTKQIPVVVMTSSQEEEDQNASFRLGADDFIRKPTGFFQFIEIVHDINAKWLDSNRAGCPQVVVDNSG